MLLLKKMPTVSSVSVLGSSSRSPVKFVPKEMNESLGGS